MSDCITCKKNNKGDNWRNCRLKCHYKYEQRKKDEIYKLKEVLQEVKSIAKGIRSYLEVPAPRDVRFEMDRILDLIRKVELSDQKESEERC